MKIFAQIENNLIINYAKFANDAELPDGWIDVTGIDHNIGDPLDDDSIPLANPSQYHTLMSDNSGWEITPENQTLKDVGDAENLRLSEIVIEQEAAGLKKIKIAAALDKIDQIFADKTTAAQIRSATILALKKMLPYILR